MIYRCGPHSKLDGRVSDLGIVSKLGVGSKLMTLWSDFLDNDKRILHKWKHYFPIYERHFKDFVYRPVTFMEIGCGRGGSLQMWKRYFGPHARIIGVDVNPDCKTFEEDQVEVHIGRQQDVQFLQSVIHEVGIPDIVLDDGSHVMSDITSTFQFLYPRMAKNGIYMVEDLHTSYWEEYEGGCASRLHLLNFARL